MFPPRVWRRTKSYHAYRARVADARSVTTVLDILEAQLQTASGRRNLFMDFEPADTFARSLLHAMGRRMSRPVAERAAAILTRLWLNVPVAAKGRDPVETLTKQEVERILVSKASWTATVTDLWTLWPDRRTIVRKLSSHGFTEAQMESVRKMLSRSHARPSHLVNQLVAWQLRIPVRRVRAAKPGGDYDELISM